MIDFSKIKLIIWDLDNTFWKGIISETNVITDEKNIQLIKDLTNCGIINSICSKNTHEVCEKKLTDLELYEYFVFPSINWQSKGQRIKEQIQAMGLRPANVLFIDDDKTNLNEAKFYSNELMIAEPDIISSIIEFIATQEKKDKSNSRLLQYKVLEKKQKEQTKYSSNEEFLFASNIQVQIKTDCISQIERIHDLIQRSNQLNFTKIRVSIDELSILLADTSYQCGYIEVDDKFGVYGIVGFYALKNSKLEHFTFSCRTIGLGVEQYVFAQLDFPKLKIVGEVVNTVNNYESPRWINMNNIVTQDSKSPLNTKSQLKILFKGPCDLSRTINYLEESSNFTTEFTYVNNKQNNTIEAHNHSSQIVGIKKYSEKDKNTLADECIFIDKEMFNGTIFTEKYDLIFLSTLIEANFGIYQKKGTDLCVAFGSYLSPLTNPENWDDYVNEKLFTANNKFNKEYLKQFTEQYEFIGKTKPEDYISNLTFILNNTHQDCIICLILGVEIPFEKNLEYDFKERHLSHIELNDAIRKFAINNKRIKLLDLNDIVKSQSDFTNNLNHYNTKVYYNLALKIVDIISETTGFKTKKPSSLKLLSSSILNSLKSFILKNISQKNAFFKFIYKLYKK